MSTRIKIMQKILIATSNKGKIKEITAEFEDLPFQFIGLSDLRLDRYRVEENYNTTRENALQKACFYAKKSKLLTIAEDSGLFIGHLKGQPGVLSKRFGKDALDSNRKILNAMRNVPTKKRGAFFEATGSIYNPENDSFSVFRGTVAGIIANKIGKVSREGMGYDSIFIYPPKNKTFAELSLLEKNQISHRGKVANQIKCFLQKQNSARQIIASVAVIIKNHKILATQRRDMRPELNGKWEFPGGGIEYGESIISCLKREVKEETGYNIAVLEQLPNVFTIVRDHKMGNYQVHLMLFICKIKSGKYLPSDSETMDHGWFSLNELLKLDLIPLNKKSIQSKNNFKIIKKYL